MQNTRYIDTGLGEKVKMLPLADPPKSVRFLPDLINRPVPHLLSQLLRATIALLNKINLLNSAYLSRFISLRSAQIWVSPLWFLSLYFPVDIQSSYCFQRSLISSASFTFILFSLLCYFLKKRRQTRKCYTRLCWNM